jgi:circadian clock protein KaiC
MDTATTPRPGATEISTGVDGLDDILAGGYAGNRIHLIEGQPGTGKTTLALQFLLQGCVNGERCLYVTLSESRNELLHVASTHGWSLDGIKICELIPPELSLDRDQDQTVVYSADLELGETVSMVMAEIEQFRPSRVVFDSLAEIRLLAQGALRYRRQILALKHYFAMHDSTAQLLDDLTRAEEELSLHSLVHGVIRLEQLAAQYGAERRRLRVSKMRGRQFRGGFHDFVIRKGGIRLFPRLVAADFRGEEFFADSATSGVAELDQLLGGGLDSGTSTLIMGPSGCGKSALSLQYVAKAVQDGHKVLVVVFDEARHVMLRRAAGIGMELAPHISSGKLVIEQVDPAEFPPGELSALVRRYVEQEGVKLVVLDSLNGYQSAMPEESFMILQIHELLTYLNQRGVVTILILAQQGLVGPLQSPVELTYVSDTVILLRFFETDGCIRRAVSVLKKRTGNHEALIREYRIDSKGIRIGPPLAEFHGVLTGIPTFSGTSSNLLSARGNGAQ